MLKRLLLVCCVLALVACSTTSEVKPLYKDKISKSKEVEARVQIALIYLQDDKNSEAIAELQRAQEVDPNSPRMHEVLALSLEKVTDYKRANTHFKKMLKLDPSYSRGRANYGYYLMRQEDYVEAYKHLQKVADDIYYPQRAMVYQQMAVCAQLLGKNEEMISNYQKAIAIDRNFAPPLLELAKTEFNNGNYPKAQAYFEQYREKVEQSSADALLLGIKLAIAFQDRNAEASYALVLKNLYPYSQEYLDYLALKKAENK